MSYLTKENFKQEIRDKIIDLNHADFEDYVEAFKKVMEWDNIICAECSNDLYTEEDIIYCETCYEELKNKIKKLEEELEELKNEKRIVKREPIK